MKSKENILKYETRRGIYSYIISNPGLHLREIERRMDFWEEKEFSDAILNIDTSDPNALDHKIYYSLDGMNTWSDNWYSHDNLTTMPSSRWVKIITNITTNTEIFIRDISFDFS